MLNWLRTFFNTHIITTVPDELSACMDCGAVQCSNDKFQGCPYRLSRAASLRAARSGEAANAAARGDPSH
jgi:hypothetical protein